MTDVMESTSTADVVFESETGAQSGQLPNPLHGKNTVGDPSRNGKDPAGRVRSKSDSSGRSPRANHLEHDPDQVDKMRALFSVFDTDGNGDIDAEELQEGLEKHGVRISPVDSRSMLKSIDRAGTDGNINFDDFYDVMHRSGATTGEVADVVHVFVGVRGVVTGASKLILECEEDEEHLAKPAIGEGDDLFEILQQGLVAKATEAAQISSGITNVDHAMEVFNMADTDNDQHLDPSELRKIVAVVMGADIVTDSLFKNLFRQIDVRSTLISLTRVYWYRLPRVNSSWSILEQVDDSGDITVGEFKDWWDLRMQDAGNEVTIDPQAVAMRMMEQQSGMISPNSRFRQRWDIFQAFLLVYVAVSVPYRICFDDAALVWSFWFTVDVALDLYFVVDVFLNFRTAIVTRDGEVVYEKKPVALRYLRSWFTVDFISCLPFGQSACNSPAP